MIVITLCVRFHSRKQKNMEKIIKYTGLMLLFLWLLQSCSSSDTFDESRPLQVVATTSMVADLVKNIGKDSIQLTSLMGPGVDPHLYKATQGDLKQLRAADIIFYNGLHLEGKMGEVFEKLERIKTVVPIARGIAKDRLIKDPE